MSADRAGTPPPATRLPRCPESVWGYDVVQVDAVLALARKALQRESAAPGTPPGAVVSTQIRAAAFDGARGGYRTEAVDEALDAAEDALAAVERDRFLSARGPDAWQRHLDELTTLLRGRLDRPRTHRFRHPPRPRSPGYSAAHVDVLCDRLSARLDGAAELSPSAVRRAVFPSAHGERSYEEQQVDAFLDRAVQLLLALR